MGISLKCQDKKYQQFLKYVVKNKDSSSREISCFDETLISSMSSKEFNISRILEVIRYETHGMLFGSHIFIYVGNYSRPSRTSYSIFENNEFSWIYWSAIA